MSECLHCGECTFLKESQDGLGGSCAHPEKEPASIDVKVSDMTTKEAYDLQIGTYAFRSYESPCRYGFCDIWAARGSARLIWNESAKETSKIMPTPEMMRGLLGAVTDPLLAYKRGGI